MTFGKRRPIGLSALASALLLTLACTPARDESAADAVAHCRGCHGETGMATQPAFPNLAGQHYDYLVKQLTLFRTGERGGEQRGSATMEYHAGKLNDAEVERAARYYAAQVCKKGDYAWIGRDFQSSCAECHGAHGISADPAVPNLAGQNVPYMLSQFKAFSDAATGQTSVNRRTHRVSAHMARIAANMDSGEYVALLFYNSQGCR